MTHLIIFIIDTHGSSMYTLSLHDALPIWITMNVLGIAMVALTLQHADTTAPAVALESPYTIHSTGVELGATLTVPRRSEEHTSELQSLRHLVCRLLLEKNKKYTRYDQHTC